MEQTGYINSAVGENNGNSMVLVFVSKNAVAINLAIKNKVNPDFLDVVARSNQIETLNLLIYMNYIGAKRHEQWHQCKPQQNDL